LSLIRYSLGDSEKEIADRLGVSIGRVNNLLYAARKKTQGQIQTACGAHRSLGAHYPLTLVCRKHVRVPMQALRSWS
jgi:transcriptional regulator with XRE-family HTH domain